MRFFFDVHVNQTAVRELARRGLDVEHAKEIGMDRADDPVLLQYAIEQDRILVTRNYCDFAPLVAELNRLGRSFPGVLFLSNSIPQGDPGAHVREIEKWVNSCPPDVNPVENTYIWLP